jgi:uncharacterized UPF0160 family protein
MRFNKVITHDTTFHADEVFAVAMLIHAGHEFEVVRTRNAEVLAEAVSDPNILVLDVGGSYDPSMLNFDHHQDTELLSAAGLIYTNCKDAICPAQAQPYFTNFISSIDVMDTNRNNIYGVWSALPSGFRNTSGIIGGFNREVTDSDQQDGQFAKAVKFALTIIENEIHGALKKARSESEYALRTVLSNNVAVFDTYSAIWKSKGDHMIAVMPHANGWQIQSRDTAVATIPEGIADVGGFVFRHKSGFLAVVKDKEEIVAFAQGLLPC